MGDKCLKCGQCCSYVKDKKVYSCRYLLKKDGGLTHCSRYFHRIGTPIDFDGKFVCSYRKNTKYDFEGCPYNSNKEIVDWRGVGKE